MNERRIHTIRILLILAVSLALIGSNVYTYLQLRQHAEVINRQGVLLKAMIDTPEINVVVARYVQTLKDQENKK